MVKRVTVSMMMLVAACGSEPSSKLDVVYGSDDRKDVYKVDDPKLAELAKATAILLPSGSIRNPNIRKKEVLGELNIENILNHFLGSSEGKDNLEQGTSSDSSLDAVRAEGGDFFWEVLGGTIGNAKNLCEDEPFREQPTPGMCSGFLIGPDLLATAGHCLSRGCGSFKVAFNYFYDKPASERNLWQIPNSDIYTCKEILGSYVDSETMLDFGVIRLDRPVEGVEPLTLRSKGKIKAGTPLAVIGYPMGIPAKVIEGGETEATATNDRYFFVGNLDTYGGNSGSAVFNAQTYEVEGILVRGDDDLVRTSEGCYRSNYCVDRKCRGEDVTRISALKQFLDTLPSEDTPRHTVTYAQKHLELELPDGLKDGVEVPFRVQEDANLIDAIIELNVAHPYPGQVSVKLIHPEGFTINLGTMDEVTKTYDLTASYEFLHLRGLSAQGLWRLIVADTSPSRTGYVDAAKLTLVLEGNDEQSLHGEQKQVKAELKFEQAIAIPDKGQGQLHLEFENFDQNGKVKNVALTTNIEHPYVSDLVIRLIAPDGRSFPVFQGSRGSSSNLADTFGEGGVSVRGLQEAFAGADINGRWRVSIEDTGNGDVGKILGLTLKVTLEPQD